MMKLDRKLRLVALDGWEQSGPKITLSRIDLTSSIWFERILDGFVKKYDLKRLEKKLGCDLSKANKIDILNLIDEEFLVTLK